VIGGDVAQHARHKPGKDVEGDGQPFTLDQGGQGDETSAHGAGEASANDTHQNGGFERHVGSQEVSDGSTDHDAQRER
jgi:hypothetical protein